MEPNETAFEWMNKRQKAFDRDGNVYQCGCKWHDTAPCCGKKEGGIIGHHIRPRRIGGTDDLYNLITLSKTCHTHVCSCICTRKKEFRVVSKIEQKRMYLRLEEYFYETDWMGSAGTDKIRMAAEVKKARDIMMKPSG